MLSSIVIEITSQKEEGWCSQIQCPSPPPIGMNEWQTRHGLHIESTYVWLVDIGRVVTALIFHELSLSVQRMLCTQHVQNGIQKPFYDPYCTYVSAVPEAVHVHVVL